MSKMRKFIKVSYDSTDNAQNAFELVMSEFFSKVIPSKNINRVEGKSVFVEKFGCTVFDSQVKYFLLSLNGALPEGCHVS